MSDSTNDSLPFGYFWDYCQLTEQWIAVRRNVDGSKTIVTSNTAHTTGAGTEYTEVMKFVKARNDKL